MVSINVILPAFFTLFPNLVLVLGSHERDQIDDTLGVSPLVIVPRHEFDKVVIEGDTSLGIKDGRVWVTNKVGGHDLILGITENALHGSLGCSLDGSLDLSIGSGLLETDDEIDDGDVVGGDTECHSGKLAVQARNDLSDGLGGSSGAGDNVGGSTTSTTPILGGGTIHGFLSRSRGVDSGHQTLDDGEIVMDDFGEGSEAVGRAGRIRHDGGLRIVGVQVDTADVHGCVG